MWLGKPNGDVQQRRRRRRRRRLETRLKHLNYIYIYDPTRPLYPHGGYKFSNLNEHRRDISNGFRINGRPSTKDKKTEITVERRTKFASLWVQRWNWKEKKKRILSERWNWKKRWSVSEGSLMNYDRVASRSVQSFDLPNYYNFHIDQRIVAISSVQATVGGLSQSWERRRLVPVQMASAINHRPGEHTPIRTSGNRGMDAARW